MRIYVKIKESIVSTSIKNATFSIAKFEHLLCLKKERNETIYLSQINRKNKKKELIYG